MIKLFEKENKFKEIFLITFQICYFLFNFQIFSLIAQDFKGQNEKKWVFPINPNEESYLTGNMGEIRGSHFHAGLDILAAQNTEVHATAEGYISKVIISPYGYGKLLYITHPQRKKMSLYAHLNGFPEALEKYILEKQYTTQSYEIELEFSPEQFPVKAGEVVAFSGNTGFSAGAHLHFEIRDLEENIFNPSLFGFSELPKDTRPPKIQKLALNTLSSDALIEEEFGLWVQGLSPKKNGKYEIEKPIEAWGVLGVELATIDVAEKSSNTYATTKISVFVEGKEIYRFQMSPYNSELARSMNQHINYAFSRKNKAKLQRAYLADGNLFRNFYKANKQQGKLYIYEKKIYNVELKVSDVWGNTSSLKFKIKGKAPKKAVFQADLSPMKERVSYKVFENTLQISAKHLKFGGEKAYFTMYGLRFEVLLFTQKNGEVTYNWDLRKGLPDFVEVGGQIVYFNFYRIIPPKQKWTYRNAKIALHFSEESLFDTLYLEIIHTSRGVRIGNADIPLFKPFTIELYDLPKKFIKEKTAIYWGGSWKQESFWKADTLIAEIRNLGDLMLLEDKKAPTLELIQRIPVPVFKVKDNISGIKTYKAFVNGSFVLMEYEPKLKQLKAKTISKDFDFRNKTFLLELTDGAGNTTKFEEKF